MFWQFSILYTVTAKSVNQIFYQWNPVLYTTLDSAVFCTNLEVLNVSIVTIFHSDWSTTVALYLDDGKRKNNGFAQYLVRLRNSNYQHLNWDIFCYKMSKKKEDSQSYFKKATYNNFSEAFLFRSPIRIGFYNCCWWHLKLCCFIFGQLLSWIALQYDEVLCFIKTFRSKWWMRLVVILWFAMVETGKRYFAIV